MSRPNGPEALQIAAAMRDVHFKQGQRLFVAGQPSGAGRGVDGAARVVEARPASMSELLCARCSRPIDEVAVRGPDGWMHGSCAPPTGAKSSAWLPVLLGCGVLGAILFFFLALLAIWQFLSPEPPPTRLLDAGPSSALTERYEMGNGLVTARYPASFAASKQGETALIVVRTSPDGNSEAVVFEAVDQPISNDLKENARLVAAAEAKLLGGYVELSNRPATCHGQEGIEVVGSFVAENKVTYHRRACRFHDGGHFYSFAYALPSAAAPEQRSLLEAIVDAAELGRADAAP
jgi:hypothetical protein